MTQAEYIAKLAMELPRPPTHYDVIRALTKAAAFNEQVCEDCGGKGGTLPNGVPYCNCEIPHAT